MAKPRAESGEEPSLGDTDLLGGTGGRGPDRESGSVQIAEAKPRGRHR